MKNYLSAIAVASILLAAPAFAADMAVKAPPVAPAPVTDWTGVYFGIAGGALHDSETARWPGAVLPNSQFSHSGNAGFLFGVFVGAQVQFANWVIGAEASGNFVNKSNLHTGSPLNGCPNPVFMCTAGMQQFMTVGPRLGYVVLPTVMVYGTGGWAAGQIEATSATPAGLTADDITGWDRRGWFVGGGAEWMVNKTKLFDLILGIDYKHINLDGTVTLQSPQDPAGLNRRDVSSMRADAVMARLSLKWNPPH